MKTIAIIILTILTTTCFSQIKLRHFGDDDRLIGKVKYNTPLIYFIKGTTLMEVLDGERSIYRITNTDSNIDIDEFKWNEYTCIGINDVTTKFTFIHNTKKKVRIDYPDGTYSIIRGIVKQDNNNF